MGDREYGLSAETIAQVAEDIKEVHQRGIQVCLVIGGGNIFRGISGATQGIDRTTGDFMGMLATVINSLAMQNVLEKHGVPTRVVSAIPMASVCEPYIRRRAIRHMEKGRIVIFAAGIGSPFFTTDTPAAVRASEMECDLIMKGTKTDGIYDKDPFKFGDALHYDTLTYQEVLVDNLAVMDASAISLARDNNIPIVVFSIRKPGELGKVLLGKGKFTLVHKDK